MTVRVQSGSFDSGRELAALGGAETKAGAMACFVGKVRSESANPIASMTIEHYPGMTEAAISQHVDEAKRRWPLLDCLVIHRFGKLMPGENIVMVAVLAEHRSEAFRAAEFLMDYLKSRAPFWKKEMTPAGSRWVEAVRQDEEALQRWDSEPASPDQNQSFSDFHPSG